MIDFNFQCYLIVPSSLRVCHLLSFIGPIYQSCCVKPIYIYKKNTTTSTSKRYHHIMTHQQLARVYIYRTISSLSRPSLMNLLIATWYRFRASHHGAPRRRMQRARAIPSRPNNKAQWSKASRHRTAAS